MVAPDSFNTTCVHAGTVEDLQTFGVTSPVFVSTANRYPNAADRSFYPRYQTVPNQTAVVHKLAQLEGAEEGAVFSSGMAAITTALLSFLHAGDHAVFSQNLYGGTYHFVTTELSKYRIEYTLVKTSDVGDFEAAVRSNTKLIYIETPSNPLCEIIDVAAIGALGRRRNIITMADNTFATPINQSVIELGLDVAIHSATKYLNGHSDLAAGIVVSSKKLMEKITPKAVMYGGNLSPRDAHLLERGMKTLNLRVQQHNKNALALAQYLEKHPSVSRVYYPGFNEVAKKQMRGFGGMLAFEMKGTLEHALEVTRQFKVVAPALSLGGVETTVCFPSQSSHSYLSGEERLKLGITDTLLRVSVGIEDINDLINDFKQALNYKSKL